MIKSFLFVSVLLSAPVAYSQASPPLQPISFANVYASVSQAYKDFCLAHPGPYFAPCQFINRFISPLSKSNINQPSLSKTSNTSTSTLSGTWNQVPPLQCQNPATNTPLLLHMFNPTDGTYQTIEVDAPGTGTLSSTQVPVKIYQSSSATDQGQLLVSSALATDGTGTLLQTGPAGAAGSTGDGIAMFQYINLMLTICHDPQQVASLNALLAKNQPSTPNPAPASAPEADAPVGATP